MEEFEIKCHYYFLIGILCFHIFFSPLHLLCPVLNCCSGKTIFKCSSPQDIFSLCAPLCLVKHCVFLVRSINIWNMFELPQQPHLLVRAHFLQSRFISYSLLAGHNVAKPDKSEASWVALDDYKKESLRRTVSSLVTPIDSAGSPACICRLQWAGFTLSLKVSVGIALYMYECVT